jgi:aminopeptidase N
MRHVFLALAVLTTSCTHNTKTSAETPYGDPQDFHSYSNPREVRVTQVALDLEVLFERRVLRGTATLALQRPGGSDRDTLILDTRDLTIRSVESSANSVDFQPVPWVSGAADRILGAPLRITVPRSASHVRVTYETSPGATGLQWLNPAQTATKKYPFLYSQSEAIHARSWIPIQDSPGVRVTWSARIRTPKELAAVMSGENRGQLSGGDYTISMNQPVPPYLIALAVGKLEYQPVSTRSGIYAEPPVVAKAAAEFSDLEKLITTAETLYGQYQWRRYDVLVLPPSFPYGGMENPMLTFVTPTLLAGDKSLVGVISHELAHSWSGNLVTNATWRDFWLNEGFTTYIENRIQEQVFGPERALMEAQLERRALEQELKELPERDQILYIDLKGRDPDEGSTQVPYVKGMLLLRRMEELFGREAFDSFLRMYFVQFAFQSITTGDFVLFARQQLFAVNPGAAARLNLDDWLRKPGLPPDAPNPQSESFRRISEAAKAWLAGRQPLPDSGRWSTQEWLGFLTALPTDLSRARMAELDARWNLTSRKNAEIRFQWLVMSVRSGYTPAFDELRQFLLEVGRRKFIRPLYAELVKTPEGRKRAEAIYRQARPGYHPISQAAIDELLK